MLRILGSTNTCEKSVISVATFYNERRPQPLRSAHLRYCLQKKLELQNSKQSAINCGKLQLCLLLNFDTAYNYLY